MKRALLLLMLSVGYCVAQDMDSRVRQEVLDQQHPVIVNVSTRCVTTLQFPAPIQSLESDAFTIKPGEEAADFVISPGLNWVSIRSLRPGAQSNLGVVIGGKVFEVFVQTVEENDFSVLFAFTHVPKSVPRTQPIWSPPLARSAQ